MRKIISFIILVLVAYAVFPFVLRQANCDPDLGTGVLYVYTDNWGGTLASKDAEGNYIVEIDTTYFIRIWGITEFNVGDHITVKISWTDNTGEGQTHFINYVEVKNDGVRYVDVEWHVPANAMVCVTSTVHYTKEGYPEYVVTGKTNPQGEPIPHHMHVIPTTLLGALGSVLALFTSLGLYKIRKKE